MKPIKTLINELTLEEKVRLLSGKNMWQTASVERLGIPSIFLADGPHGIRRQSSASEAGLEVAKKATCYPSAVLLGSTWNKNLLKKMGQALASEATNLDVDVILGPGLNLKRHPFNGRNFEYYSEDPLLSGEMAASLVAGIQENGVGTSIKHFVANNQEKNRMVTDVIVDDKALRELYLKGFEIVIKKANPWTVMAAYNQVNSAFATESLKLLKAILRDEWGYKGLVVSDWGATNDRVNALRAQMALEMPSSGNMHDENVLNALNDGSLSEETLNENVEDLLNLVKKVLDSKKVTESLDTHALASEIAKEGMVLLKNDDQTLPLKKESSLALIGAFAKNPRIQGGGSSHINPSRITTPYDALKSIFNDQLFYADGYDLENDTLDETLIQEAIKQAKNADQVVIFAGLPDLFESEGYDRTHLNLPKSHNHLIEVISQIKPVTVCLMNGSPVAMPWVDKVKAILELYLPGQNVGDALKDVLLGDVSPSGKLAESFPLNIEDLLANQNFPGNDYQVIYKESIFVGYRDLNTFDKAVLFPFGHGLSYTTFSYSNLFINQENQTLYVTFDITNDGNMNASEIVQIYISKPQTNVLRAGLELKGFDKVWLKKGETKSITISISKGDLNVFVKDQWIFEDGIYLVQVGASSRDIRLSDSIMIHGESNKDLIDLNAFNSGRGLPHELFKTLYQKTIPLEKQLRPFTLNSKLVDYEKIEIGKYIYQMAHERLKTMFNEDTDETLKAMFINMFDDMPIRQIASMMGDILPLTKINQLNETINKQ